jgi:hypothetical protein
MDSVAHSTSETLRDLLVARGYSESEIADIVLELQKLMKAEVAQRCFEMVPESAREEIRRTPDLLLLPERHQDLVVLLRPFLSDEAVMRIGQEVFDSVTKEFITYLKQTHSKQD